MYTYLGLAPVSLCTCVHTYNCMLRVTMKKLAQNTLKHSSWGWSAFFLDARGICVLPFRFAGTQLTMIHRDWRLGFGHSTYTLVVLIEPRFQVGPTNAFFCVFRTPYTYEISGFYFYRALISMYRYCVPFTWPMTLECWWRWEELSCNSHTTVEDVVAASPVQGKGLSSYSESRALTARAFLNN